MTDPVRFDLADGMSLAGVSIREVWWRYAALGGRAGLDILSGRIDGTVECTANEHDLIAQVLNEVFYDNGLDTFPVGYIEIFRSLPKSPYSPEPVGPTGKRDAWQRADEARRASARAARQAAELHLTAAKLMHASGQLRLARQAHVRAFSAFSRSQQLELRAF